jgi:hypothetical protein
MELNLEKALQTVKKEIETLKEKFNKFADALLKEEKPAKKTKTKKTAAKKKTVAKKKVTAKKKQAAKKKAAPKKKTAKKKAPVKKTAEGPTAFETVVDIISKSNEGVDVATIATKTGFDSKKIANIIYKANKKGLIKSAKKGVYVKA